MSGQAPQLPSDMQQVATPVPIAEAFVALQAVMRTIVDERDQILFTSEVVDGEITLRVRCSDSDVGKLIGKQGRVARSLRILLYAMTSQYKLTVHLDIDKHSAPVRGRQ